MNYILDRLPRDIGLVGIIAGFSLKRWSKAEVVIAAKPFQADRAEIGILKKVFPILWVQIKF